MAIFFVYLVIFITLSVVLSDPKIATIDKLASIKLKGSDGMIHSGDGVSTESLESNVERPSKNLQGEVPIAAPAIFPVSSPVLSPSQVEEVEEIDTCGCARPIPGLEWDAPFGCECRAKDFELLTTTQSNVTVDSHTQSILTIVYEGESCQ